MHTGLTFGNNTSPSNWEPIARTRQQLAQQSWHDPDIIHKAAQYMLPSSFIPPATGIERANLAKAFPDSKIKEFLTRRATGKHLNLSIMLMTTCMAIYQN
jgi:hypothetical protein